MEMEDGGVGAACRGHAGACRHHPSGASLGIDEGHVAKRCADGVLVVVRDAFEACFHAVQLQALPSSASTVLGRIGFIDRRET